ncbi:GM19508 [Drosophila sechellia]|uniref:GM19508 n=1 Tax=Drosophila sechellia TaxID=7238 RepID=B4I6D6_DROSE|nr:GM19508 [Drosophila sechellia]
MVYTACGPVRGTHIVYGIGAGLVSATRKTKHFRPAHE